jgi:hypothetical protein
MAVHLVDIKARLMVERDVDGEDLCGNICARIEEQLLKGETLIDIELESTTLPLEGDNDGDGSCDSGRRTCPQTN